MSFCITPDIMRLTEKEWADLQKRNKSATATIQKPALLHKAKAIYSFAVPGVPVPKARPRLGKNGNVYTPDKTTRAEAAIRSCAELAGVKPIVGAIRMSITFAFTRPEKCDRMYPSVRPDADNLAKTVLDALSNGVAYRDDGQIIELVLVKEYAAIAQTLIDIHEL